MAHLMILAMMYVAVGAGLFAQPRPGAARPGDFGWRRQGEIFLKTLPAVLCWPMALWRALSQG
jgi:hypothetical protein